MKRSTKFKNFYLQKEWHMCQSTVKKDESIDLLIYKDNLTNQNTNI